MRFRGVIFTLLFVLICLWLCYPSIKYKILMSNNEIESTYEYIDGDAQKT